MICYLAMKEQRQSPSTYVLASVAGGLIAASAWFVSFAHLGQQALRDGGFWLGVWNDRLRYLAVAIPLLVGIPFAFWAQRRLRRGLLDDVWTEAELTRARRLFVKPIWRWANYTVFVAALLLLFFLAPRHSYQGAFFYLLFLPTHLMFEMRQMLAPRGEHAGGLGDWRDAKPLRSEHWGEPVPGSGQTRAL